LTEGYKFHDIHENGAITIGIPRGLMIFYQQFPYWRTFFEELGFRVMLSGETSNQTVIRALSLISAETCFPVEVMHGHIYELLDKGADYIFTPFIMNSKKEQGNPTSNCNCPWIQTYPFMVKASLEEKLQERLLIPALNYRYGDRLLENELYEGIGKKFNISQKRIRLAMGKAKERQDHFEDVVKRRGKEILKNLPPNKECVVIMGRPYNTGDPALNLSMVEKLINLDVFPIPMDFLPLEEESITKDYTNMYWPNGQRILAAARIVARDDRLNAVYMGNFRCGPDSFLSHFVNEIMKEKPYLEIEIDEHSADAGMITRYEAFLDSIKGYRMRKGRGRKEMKSGKFSNTLAKGRTLYFPYMNDHAYAIAAACRSFGVDSDVLPMQTKEDLEVGRKYTSSRECFPMICTTGSFLKKLFEPGSDPEKLSFFMPDHTGPCRFGQYNRFQRILFDRLGLKKTQIISPSNETAYEDISGGHATRFRYNAWKGFVAVDILRKLYQERKPYEITEGSVKEAYNISLKELIASMEDDTRGLVDIVAEAAKRMGTVPLNKDRRKPVVAVVGEIFMRDNPFCSGFLIQKLEKLGVETWVAPFSEWISYSTLRYRRDTKWKKDLKGMLKARLQEYFQENMARRIIHSAMDYIDLDKEIHVKDLLDNCGAYVHRHYDGDPAMNLGTSVILAKKGISGIANILPFTCMPGTLVTALSRKFKKDHNNIPYVNIAYDGQEDTSIDMRLEAFVHQSYQYYEAHFKSILSVGEV
ncbi:MAG: acyl-CoA dehydratase activase-related protein, partial [Bacteroidales bacterium]